MLIGTLSNGFIAAISRPALPKLVDLVERAFLPSLKRALLPILPRGGRRKAKVAHLEEEVRKALGKRYTELRDCLTNVKRDAKVFASAKNVDWRASILDKYDILKNHTDLLENIDPYSVPSDRDASHRVKAPWEIAIIIAAREKIPCYENNGASPDALKKAAILPDDEQK